MEAPPRHLAKICPNIWVINLAAIPLGGVCALAFILFAHALPHHQPQNELSLVWFLPGIVVTFSLHEMTHAAAAAWRCKFPWSAFKFGFNAKSLCFLCHCRRPLDLAAYRMVSLAPLAILGPLSLLLVVLHPADWLALTAGIHLAGCIGDVWIFRLLRKYPHDVLVVDHPTEIGCDLYSRALAVSATNDVIEK